MLEPLFGLGFEFLELHAPEAFRETKAGKVVRLGKAPIHKRWTTAEPLGEVDAYNCLVAGRNVGVRLRDRDLVIDVDPRNGGDTASLEKALGVKLREVYPYVVTGSDGLHIYMAKPAGLRVGGKLDGFPGIEFKTHGTQVVAPGSVHPDTLRRYEADILADFRAIPDAPEELLGLLEVQDIVWPAEAGRHEPEELAAMLSALDVLDYADQDRWLELMMACHFATAGAGREEFVAWSIGDPDYAHDEEVIRHRWDSLRLDKGRSVTERTLYKRVIDAKRADLIPSDPDAAAADFADVIGEDLEPVSQSGDLHFVEEMNKTFCAVLDGGKFRVFMEDTDYAYGTPRRVFVRLERQSFLHFYENDRVIGADGLPRQSKAALWLQAPKRRTYKGIVMAPEGARPGVLNLWRGWAVPSKPGSWSRTRAFIHDVLASGNQEAGDYILKWMAFMFQKPHILPQVALVFRGLKGTGKGTLGKALLNIAGDHGMTVSHTDQFAGRFDAHLRDCVYLFADEALWAGDKAAEGKLKQLITEPSRTYEAKGVDPAMGRNLVHVVMASNADWVVPASADERRYAIFDVSDARKQDKAYFGPINDELYKAGGLSAMLHDLLSMDLGDWVPYGNVPKTEGSAAQKVLSLEPMPRWWFKALQCGDPTGIGFFGQDWSKDLGAVAGEGKGNVLTSLESMYPRKPFTMKALAQFLQGVGVDVKGRDTRGNRVWLVPQLDQARQAFADWLGEDLTWED